MVRPVQASEPASFGIDSSRTYLLPVDLHLHIQFAISLVFPSPCSHFCFLVFASLLDRVIVYFRLVVIFRAVSLIVVASRVH